MGGRKKKLKASVPRTAAMTPGPLSHIQADMKMESRRIRATVESAGFERSFRPATVTPTSTAAAGYPTHRLVLGNLTPRFYRPGRQIEVGEGLPVFRVPFGFLPGF